MKIINRIMISSALLVLLSLISLLIVLSITIFLSSGNPGREVLDKDVFQAGKTLDEFDSETKGWNRLKLQLSVYGYNLLVLDGNSIVFSSLSSSQSVAIDNLKTMELGQNPLAGAMQELTFVAKARGTYSIFAVKSEAGSSNTSNDFWLPFLILTLVFIVIILLLSQLFTRKMAWRILRPLSSLSEAAKRIENGDLSRPVAHSGEDEFSSVCSAFNNMQEYLLKEREKNAAYERARTDLIAGISHDLRTPLTSVKGYIKGLRDGVANTPQKREQYLSIAYEKAGDMDTLLQKLFFFSKLETGNLPLSLRHEDLGCFVRRYLKNIQDELDCKNVRIAPNVTAVPHPVEMDSEQMRRVLLNLIENAMKYANTKPLVLHISVWREHDKEHLLFADNGQGVPPKHLPRLFERFWRGDEARGAKSGEGSGLGLYIVKHIVEAHGGTVAAENDKGLQIKISLPCGKGENP